MTGTAFFGNAWQGSRASFGEVFPFAEALEFYRDARAREDFLFVEALETSPQRLQGKTSRSRKP
jgi:hypothetical protein